MLKPPRALPLVIAAALCSAALPVAAEKLQISIGATSSSSGYYAWCVGQAQVVNKYVPEVNATLVGGGRGGIAFAKKVIDGTIDWSAMGTLAIPNMIYHGTGPFKEKPWEPIRIFFMREEMVYRMYALADSGAKSWSDLKGKRFNPGTPGSTNARNAVAADAITGSGLEMVPGTVAESLQAMRQGRLVGMNKSSPRGRFDKALKELSITKPVSVVGFTAEQAAAIQAKHPLITFRKTPANSITDLPGHPELIEMTSIGMTLTSANLPEEIGYKIIKALHQHWDEVAQSYPPVASYDPVRDLIRTIPKGAEIPLHAGVVRYAKEIGIDVPPQYIPPEYKGG